MKGDYTLGSTNFFVAVCLNLLKPIKPELGHSRYYAVYLRFIVSRQFQIEILIAFETM
jgi:hypothetical protein